MRITNSIIQSASLASIQENLQGMATAQQQVASGTRLQVPSDDPTAAAAVLRTDSQLRALDQYGRNIDNASSRLGSEENVLNQLTNLLSRAEQLAVSQGGSTANADTRAAARQEVEQLKATAVDLGNTTLAGVYLFGGVYGDKPPFDATGATDPARPPVGQHDVEIAADQRAASNHDGNQVFVASGVLASLTKLSDALAANDGTAVAQAGRDVNTAFNDVQSLLGEVGARSARLQVAKDNISSFKVNLQSTRSNLADVDMETAVTQLVSRQSTYQAALAATARVMQTTLTDYLR